MSSERKSLVHNFDMFNKLSDWEYAAWVPQKCCVPIVIDTPTNQRISADTSCSSGVSSRGLSTSFSDNSTGHSTSSGNFNNSSFSSEGNQSLPLESYDRSVTKQELLNINKFHRVPNMEAMQTNDNSFHLRESVNDGKQSMLTENYKLQKSVRQQQLQDIYNFHKVPNMEVMQAYDNSVNLLENDNDEHLDELEDQAIALETNLLLDSEVETCGMDCSHNYPQPDLNKSLVPRRMEIDTDDSSDEGETMPITYPPFDIIDPYLARSSTPKKNICRFCSKNRESSFVYASHHLKEHSGKVTCPYLRNYTCNICGATGDNAHTRTFCPFNTEVKCKKPFRLLANGVYSRADSHK